MIDVIAETAKCSNCGEETLLGDGLCVRCWDSDNRPLLRIHRYKLYPLTCSTCGDTIRRRKSDIEKENYCVVCAKRRLLVGIVKEICPHCKSNDTKKRSRNIERQMYFCHSCNKSFIRTSELLKGGINREGKLKCRKCGSTKLRKSGTYKGKQILYCSECKRRTYVV